MENKNNKKGLGIASMVLGIIAASFLLLSLATFAFLALAVILGIIGLFLAIFAKKCGQKTAGLILNIVSITGSLVIVPIILGIINDLFEQKKQRQAELLGSEVRLAYTSYLFDNSGAGDSDNFCDYMTEDYLEVDGYVGTCIKDSLNVIIDDETYSITYNNGIVTITGALEDVEVKLK